MSDIALFSASGDTAMLLGLLLVGISNEGWFAGFGDDWFVLRVILCVAVGLVAGGRWNRSRRRRGVIGAEASSS